MKKGLTLSMLLLMAFFGTLQAQTMEELAERKAAKAAELAEKETRLAELSGEVEALTGEVADLTDQLTPYPRWDLGTFGTVGLSLAKFNDWLSKDQSNTSATTIGFAFNAFANLDQKKYFWKNGGNVNLGWLKFVDQDAPEGSDEFNVTADAFNLTSLYGYKLSEKIAISALGEYRTAILDGKFNDPGYLDLGVGATWTPIPAMTVVVHPLNYNFVFSNSDFDYQSSLGAKFVVDYARSLSKGISWKTNFSGFLSYKDSDLHNWTWINGFSTAVKGIGVGLEVGFRGNKQEALAAGLADSPVQTYYVLGLTYAL